MSTITLEQLATLTVDFLASPETNTKSSMVLAQLTERMLGEEDCEKFMNLVAEGAIKMLTEALEEAVK